jgi:hypothetical protein
MKDERLSFAEYSDLVKLEVRCEGVSGKEFLADEQIESKLLT